MFHDTKERRCVREALMFRDVREGLCATWLWAFLEGMGAHVRAGGLKAESVRKSLLVAMAGCWKAGSFWLGFIVSTVELIDYVIQCCF